MRSALALARSRATQGVSGRRTVAGQAMVLGLTLILVLCVGIVLLFNTGQVVNKKVELVNAADAAAYSVAIQQARALNYAAYMNRARVANEVAIAQTISLYSWLNQMHTTSIVIRTTLDVLSAIPYIGVVFKALATAFKVAERILQTTRRVFQPVAQAAVTAIDKLNMLFAGSAQLVIEAVSRVDSYTIAKDVLQKNSPGANLGTIGTAVLGTQLATAENRLLQRYTIPRSGGGSASQRQGADRYRNVVMQSRDGFSKSRSSNFLGFLVQSGGTDMVEYDRWAALDTMAVEFPMPWPADDIDMAVGWGGAQAVGTYRNQRFLEGFGNGRGWYSEWDRRTYRPYGEAARRNRGAAWMVDRSRDANVRLASGQHRRAFFTGYTGLRDYHDVKSGQALQPYADKDSDRDKVGPVFTIYAETASRTARTSSTTNIGAPAGSRMDLPDKTVNGNIAALSSAQVFFDRPVQFNMFRRSDGRRETGNLFSPYWQARLVKTDASTRAALAAAGALMP